MNWSTLGNTVRAVLNYALFDIAGTPLTVATLLTSLFVFLLTLRLARVGARATEAGLERGGMKERGAASALGSLVRYLIYAVGFAIALQTAGIKLATLFAAGAIFAVGIGFAMKDISENFVAGIILLVERTIKPGDILEVESRVVQVRAIGIRTTFVATRDGEDLIVPNSILVQSTKKNFTLQDSVFRIRTAVGVVYSSDMKKVREVLEAAVDGVDFRRQDLPTRVIMKEFGDSSVNFEVAMWVDDPWRELDYKSSLNEAVWWALKNNGITIAFPQVDVHFDPEIQQGLSRIGRAG